MKDAFLETEDNSVNVVLNLTDMIMEIKFVPIFDNVVFTTDYRVYIFTEFLLNFLCTQFCQNRIFYKKSLLLFPNSFFISQKVKKRAY